MSEPFGPDPGLSPELGGDRARPAEESAPGAEDTSGEPRRQRRAHGARAEREADPRAAFEAAFGATFEGAIEGALGAMLGAGLEALFGRRPGPESRAEAHAEQALERLGEIVEATFSSIEERLPETLAAFEGLVDAVEEVFSAFDPPDPDRRG